MCIDCGLFISLAKYYSKFIKGYSKKVPSFKDLPRNDKMGVGWELSRGFDKLKDVASEPLVSLPDFESFRNKYNILDITTTGVLA